MLKINKITTLILALSFCSLTLNAQKTIVEIKGNQFFINGKPTYEGRYWNGNKIEGLLMNSRMVQGIFDDLNSKTSAEFAYADTKKWDADRNANEFIAAMPLWYAHGLTAFTLNMQGGSPYGYGNKKCLNPGFNPDGSLMQPYMNRLDKILKRADELNMVVILGLFYFGQDQNVKDETAVINAVDNLTNWIFEKGYRNVMIEINNECDHPAYDHTILRPNRVSELIERVKNKQPKGYRLLVSTSFTGKKVPTANVVKAADFLLIHGNGAKDPKQIQLQIDSTKMVDGYRNMPIVNNEDDHFDFEKDTNNFTVSIRNYVSWGYFDFRFPKETAYTEGYQSVPVDWGINSERKKGFFNKVREITGVNGGNTKNTEGGKIGAIAAKNSLIFLNEERISKTKQLVKQKDKRYSDAYKKLIVAADKALTMDANPVVKKTVIPPSGDKHDYISIAPYFWADSTKPNGLPWISKDGQVNPLTRGNNTDQTRTHDLWDALQNLSLAYYFSDDVKYANKAKNLIKIWFIDAETKVNPNINYGQSVPGGAEGRPLGVIEWDGCSHLITTLQLLEKDNLITPAYKNSVDKWINDYTQWLLTSKLGMEEDRQPQNHGNWYDFQVVGLLRYLGRNEEAKARVEAAKKRIASQIQPDGSMPLELRRTKSVYYCEMNLRAMTFVTEMGRPLGVDLWAYETADGRSMKKAFDYLRPFALGEKEWKEKQIIGGGAKGAIEDRLKPLFSIASTVYGEKLIDDKANVSANLSYLQILLFPPLAQ